MEERIKKLEFKDVDFEPEEVGTSSFYRTMKRMSSEGWELRTTYRDNLGLLYFAFQREIHEEEKKEMEDS